MKNTQDNKRLAFNRIKSELDKVSDEMLSIISKYKLEVKKVLLDIIKTAKQKITDKDDYVKFIELSLQGRLLGEAIQHLDATDENLTKIILIKDLLLFL